MGGDLGPDRVRAVIVLGVFVFVTVQKDNCALNDGKASVIVSKYEVEWAVSRVRLSSAGEPLICSPTSLGIISSAMPLSLLACKTDPPVLTCPVVVPDLPIPKKTTVCPAVTTSLVVAPLTGPVGAPTRPPIAVCYGLVPGTAHVAHPGTPGSPPSDSLHP